MGCERTKGRADCASILTGQSNEDAGKSPDELDPDMLLRAYSIGIFPMADSRDSEEVFWVEPRRRAIIPLHQFRFSKSLRKTVRSGDFTVTSDRAFSDVVRHCSD